MGIGIPTLEAMAWARNRLGPFGETLQIGRQGLYIVGEEFAVADTVLASNGLTGRYASVVQGSQYADEYLYGLFGANTVRTLDASPYEGADLIWDLNMPVPAEHHGRWQTILDGGCLEHIFNVPEALRNMMKMLAVGGRLISVIPANNWLGHGFYQFGPELPYRVFQPSNGFRIEFVCFAGLDGTKRLMERSDGGSVGVRGEIGHTASVIDLVFCAQKLETVEIFSRWPQQGDYDNEWTKHAAAGG